jgi:hypothetical protein
MISREQSEEIADALYCLSEIDYVRDYPIRPKKRKLPKIKPTQSFKLVSDCPICLESFKDDEQMTITHCCHLFHYDCLALVGVGRQSCPMCRAMIYVK